MKCKDKVPGARDACISEFWVQPGDYASVDTVENYCLSQKSPNQSFNLHTHVHAQAHHTHTLVYNMRVYMHTDMMTICTHTHKIRKLK